MAPRFRRDASSRRTGEAGSREGCSKVAGKALIDAAIVREGVNFSLFFRNASGVELLVLTGRMTSSPHASSLSIPASVSLASIATCSFPACGRPKLRLSSSVTVRSG
jgi:hypothetical protein